MIDFFGIVATLEPSSEGWASDLASIVIYFLFGTLGTAGHLWISPTMVFGANRQTAVRIAMGAAVGVVLPFVGGTIGDHLGVPSWVAGDLPILVKGFVIFILSLGGSYVLGDIAARRAITKAKKAADDEESKP